MTRETTGETVTSYLYDANGNLTKKDDGSNVHTYKYDASNLMTDYDGPGANNDATYKYAASSNSWMLTSPPRTPTTTRLSARSSAPRPGKSELQGFTFLPGSSSIWARVLGVMSSAWASDSWWRWNRARAASHAPWPDWTTSRSGSGRGPRCSSIQRR